MPLSNSYAKNNDESPLVKVYTDIVWEEYMIPEYNPLKSYYVRRSYNGYMYEGRIYRTSTTNQYGHYLYKGVLTLSSN